MARYRRIFASYWIGSPECILQFVFLSICSHNVVDMHNECVKLHND